MAVSSLLLLIVIFSAVPTLCSAQQCSTHSKLNNILLKVEEDASENDKVHALQALNVASLKDCATKCCLKSKCELVSFQMTGSSHTGHNCYLITCGGNLDSCLKSMVHQYGFISMGVTTQSQNASGENV